jgi:hypothetical protein
MTEAAPTAHSVPTNRALWYTVVLPRPQLSSGLSEKLTPKRQSHKRTLSLRSAACRTKTSFSFRWPGRASS